MLEGGGGDACRNRQRRFERHGDLRIGLEHPHQRLRGRDAEVGHQDRQLPIHTERKDAALVVKAELTILMTDFGITPPKALMGMLRTDPKVTVTFEAALAIPARVTTSAFKH